jgi:hypothetical protein
MPTVIRPAASQILPVCVNSGSVFQHAGAKSTHAPRVNQKPSGGQSQTDQPTNPDTQSNINAPTSPVPQKAQTVASQILPACPNTASVFQHAGAKSTHAPQVDRKPAGGQRQTDKPATRSSHQRTFVTRSAESQTTASRNTACVSKYCVSIPTRRRQIDTRSAGRSQTRRRSTTIRRTGHAEQTRRPKDASAKWRAASDDHGNHPDGSPRSERPTEVRGGRCGWIRGRLHRWRRSGGHLRGLPQLVHPSG